ncbi:MAG: adenylate kinase [Thermodesulfobacteriota bacterium]
MNLLLMGPPGAGKGTQGGRIADKYGVPVISTGDILRANVADGTELGLKAKDYMVKGDLVPDTLVLEMVAGRLEASDCEGGFILDGYPRNTPQAYDLDNTLTELGKNIDVVIGIEVESGELVRRLAGRRVCEFKNCAQAYHVEFDPPEAEGICTKCGAELYQRPDDKEETIEARLKVYEEQTRPLIDYYTDKNLYASIDGVGSLEDIAALIASAIEERQNNA